MSVGGGWLIAIGVYAVLSGFVWSGFGVAALGVVLMIADRLLPNRKSS